MNRRRQRRDMSSPARDDQGRFSESMSEQDLLKVLDYDVDEANPMLTAGEVADGLADHFGIDVTAEAVRQRLREMEADGNVASKEFGANATGWVALVAPRLAPEVAERLDDRADRKSVV